ncbi:hypothetical protein NMG60_11029233 [Bertholletia excelsa]
MPENLKLAFAVEETDGDKLIMRRTNDEPDPVLKQPIDLKPDSLGIGTCSSRNAASDCDVFLSFKGGERNAPCFVDHLYLALSNAIEESKFQNILISCSDQQKVDNQQQAKTGHLSATSGKMNKHLGLKSVCMAIFRPFIHQKEPSILHNDPNVRESSRMFLDPYPTHHENELCLRPFEHSMQEKLTDQAFPGHDDDDDASCGLAGMIVLLVASLLRLKVGHLLLSTPPLFIQLMHVFIWSGIVSGISVVLLWLLRLPRQSILLLIAIHSTIGSYACAIAVFLPFKSLRAPFLVVVISGLSVYMFVQLKSGPPRKTVRNNSGKLSIS